MGLWTILFIIAAGFIFSILHFFNEQWRMFFQKKIDIFASFGAGIIISYIFIRYFYLFYIKIEKLNSLITIYILIGFAMFHLLEKYIYQHIAKEKLVYELKEVHSIIFFIFHFATGILLVELVKVNLFEGLLFVLPMLFITAYSRISMPILHEKIRKRILLKLFLALSTFFGILFDLVIRIKPELIYAIIGLVGGALIYLVMSYMIPREQKWCAKSFFLGLISYAILIFFVWVLF